MSTVRSSRGGAVSGWLLLLLAAAYFLLPLLALARFSFQRVPVALLGWHNLFDNWTWDGLLDALHEPGFGPALWLSVRLAVGAIILTLGLLLPTALWVHLRAPTARGLVEVLSVLPYIVPPIALVVGVTGAFRELAPWFIRSDLSLIPFYTLLAMPFTYRALDAGITAIDLRTLVDASALARRGVDDHDVPSARAEHGQRPDLVGLPHRDGRPRRVHHRQPAAEGDPADVQPADLPTRGAGWLRPRPAAAVRVHALAGSDHAAHPPSQHHGGDGDRACRSGGVAVASTLEFHAVRKTFGSTVALESFDLALEPGELVCLLGPSGCGKTTALRVAAGFEHPDAGRVAIGGADVVRVPAHKRNIGMVFQSYSLFPNLDVRSNVAFGLRVRRVSSAERDRRVGEALERVHLSAMAKRYPHQLSGGQQQRVALARALVVEPAVLLLDEPLSALDAKVRVGLREEIRRLQLQLGMTTLFVTHDQEEALSIADRIGVMSNGRLEQTGTPRAVYAEPANAFVARFVGRINELPGQADDGAIAVAGVRIDVPPPAGVANGGDVTLMSRPEDVRVRAVSDGDAATGALPGTVVSEHFAGSSSLLRVRLDRLDLLVDAQVDPASDPLAPGDRVVIELRPSKLYVVPSE